MEVFLTPSTRKKDMKASVSVSLPLTLIEKVNQEAGLYGKGFSEATVLLLGIGLDMRDIEREREEKRQTERLRKLQEAADTV